MSEPTGKSIFELDGTDFRPNEEASKLIVKNDAITTYIMSRKHAPYRILVGPKGSGKSLLLRLRSWRYSKDAELLNISEGNDFSIKFDFSSGLNKNDLFTYVKDDDYRIVWEFSIKYFILRRLILDTDIEHPIYGQNELEIPGADILNRIVSNYGGSRYLTNMGDILSLLLQNRSVISDISNCLFALNGALRILEKVLDRPLSLYIDNVDQAFLEKLVEGGNKLNGIPLANWVYSREKEPIVKIWLNANIAFMRVVWNINKSFPFISLFAAVRYEAWNHFRNSGLAKNIAQVESSIILLEYNTWELTHLMENFISIQNDALKKTLLSIINQERIHPKARDSRVNSEKFGDVMIRHTFGNPRDLIYLLNDLRLEIIKVRNDKRAVDIDYYGNLIDRVSNEKVFQNFARECLPAFPYTELEDLLNKYQRNFFKQEEIEELEEILIKELFRYGLIGVVDENGKIFFERGSNYPEEKIKLPKSPFYFTHPCLDYALSKLNRNGDFYYPYCVIGNGLPFKSKNELAYYKPKSLPGKYTDKILAKYASFYDSDFSTDAFSRIPNRIKTKYTGIILENLHTSNLVFSAMIQASINKGIGSCMKKEEDLELLARNIKLRIILTLATLLGIYTKGREVIELFDAKLTLGNEGYIINTITFTHNCFTNSRAINISNVLNSLSDFEAEIVFEFLKSTEVDRFLEADNGSGEKKRTKVNEAKTIFSKHYPIYKF